MYSPPIFRLGILVMVSHDDVLKAAQAIRPYLAELLGEAEGQAIAHRIDMLLSANGDLYAQKVEVWQVLAATEPTREWLRLYLEEQQPVTQILDIIRTYQPLPGKAGKVVSPRYRCPVASCHQIWYRREMSAEIPNCPIHGVKMVRESKEWLREGPS